MSDHDDCVLVALPRALVEDVDRVMGGGEHERFIAGVVRAELRRLRHEAVERMAGALVAIDIPGWETAESTSSWVRRQREGAERLRDKRRRR